PLRRIALQPGGLVGDVRLLVGGRLSVRPLRTEAVDVARVRLGRLVRTGERQIQEERLGGPVRSADEPDRVVRLYPAHVVTRRGPEDVALVAVPRGLVAVELAGRRREPGVPPGR